MIWSTLFRIRKYKVLVKIQIMKLLDIRTRGISSRVPHTSLHIVCMDYDNVTDERLRDELKFLQEEFELGNFYVFKTKYDGRHCLCIDALTFKEVKKIIDFSSCDWLFKRAPRINEYRCWVLRFTKKGNREAPKYLYTVESPHEGRNLQSLGHAKYLLKYGLKIDLKKPYGHELIEIQDYNTGKRTKAEELDGGSETER